MLSETQPNGSWNAMLVRLITLREAELRQRDAELDREKAEYRRK